jgi:acid phosphatase
MKKDTGEKRLSAKVPFFPAIIIAAVIGAIAGGYSVYLTSSLPGEGKGKTHRFYKNEIDGLNFASGLVRGPDQTFWTVTDKGNKLIQFDQVKGVRKAVEVLLPEEIKESLVFDRLDLEGIAYDPKREVFYIISEANRAVLTVSDDGMVSGFFFVEGEDSEPNIGLEGITFDRKRDIIYIVDEGPYDRPKRLYRYDVSGNKAGEPFEIDVKERITGITSRGDDTFLALNTFRPREGKLHSVILFTTEGELTEHVNLQKDYPGHEMDSRNFQTNYEGIDLDEAGNIYLINDAVKGINTNLLVISKGVSNESADGYPAQSDKRALNALLWMNTSAEYRALCLQTYRNALAAVTDEVALRRSKDKSARLAAVMDLDETVLDNSRFNLFLMANDLKFTDVLWTNWIARNSHEVSLVPGALDFIKAVESQQVEVIFISNRSKEQKGITFTTLKRLGVFPEDAELKQIEDRLLLRADTGSKEARRQRVTESFSVVAYVGDNLADFSKEFEASGTSSYIKRNGLVMPHAADWGTRWFVLPNPVYGDWYRSLKERDIENLLSKEKN